MENQKPKNISRQERYTKQENKMIMNYVHKNGTLNGIGTILPNRILGSIKEHFVNYLNSRVNQDPLITEDELLR
jgi:hypothetical protein